MKQLQHDAWHQATLLQMTQQLSKSFAISSDHLCRVPLSVTVFIVYRRWMLRDHRGQLNCKQKCYSGSEKLCRATPHTAPLQPCYERQAIKIMPTARWKYGNRQQFQQMTQLCCFWYNCLCLMDRQDEWKVASQPQCWQESAGDLPC